MPGAASLRVRSYASRRNSTSIWCANVVKTISGYWIACCAIRCSFVDTVCDLGVSPIFPHSRVFCPASPSLQWIPWASVLHLLWYYALLRLPSVLLDSLRFVARLPIPCLLLCLCSLLKARCCTEAAHQRLVFCS